MTLQCDNCNEEFEGRWELKEVPAPQIDKKVCPECEDPNSMFSEV